MVPVYLVGAVLQVSHHMMHGHIHLPVLVLPHLSYNYSVKLHLLDSLPIKLGLEEQELLLLLMQVG